MRVINECPFRLLAIAISGAAFFLGIELGSFNLVLLTISKEFNLNTSLMGFLVIGQYLAITVTPLILGRISDRIGKKKTLIIFMPVFITGCLITAASGSVWFFITGVFVIGIGYSTCESVGSSALSDTFPGKEGRYMNIMQGAFSLGAVVSPLVFGWLINNFQLSWHWAFIIPGCGFILLYPLMVLSDCRCNYPESPGTEKNKPLFPIIKSLFFLALLFCMMAYVAIETGISYFIDSLLVTEFENGVLSAWTISGFWFSMALSRFFFALIKMKPRSMVLFGFTSAAALLILLFIFKSQLAFCASVICLGFVIGPVWPMVLSTGISAFPEQSGAVGGILYAGGGAGGIFMPLVFGLVAGNTNFYSGFLLMAFIAAAGFLVMMIWGRKPAC